MIDCFSNEYRYAHRNMLTYMSLARSLAHFMNTTHQHHSQPSPVQPSQKHPIIKQEDSIEEDLVQEPFEEDPVVDWDFELGSSDQGHLKHEVTDDSQKHTNNQNKQQTNGDITPQNLPTFQEIQNSVTMLTKLMPEMFTQEVVNTFYLQLFRKLAPNKLIASSTTASLTNPLPTPNLDPINCLPSTTQTKSQAKRQPSDVCGSQRLSQSSCVSGQGSISVAIKNQKHSQEDRQHVERKIIVNAFCSGLGFKGIQPEIRRENCLIQITEEKYLEVMKRTILQAYHYVKKLAGRRYKPIVKTRPADLLRILNNCRRTLTPFVCQIFLKALRQCCLKNLDLSVDQALRLLRGIDEGLLKSHTQLNNSQKPPRELRNERYWKQKQKVIRKEQSRNGELKEMKFELHTRWTNHFQTLLLKMYREGAAFAQIRDRFQQEYPGQSDMFTVVAIRSMFFKIMRMAVRRLTREVWKSGRKDLPPLVKMQDQLVKNIINCSQCLNLRKLLVDVYQCQTACSRQLLGKVICMINLYYENGGGFKKSQNKQRDMDL